MEDEEEEDEEVVGEEAEVAAGSNSSRAVRRSLWVEGAGRLCWYHHGRRWQGEDC